MLKRLFILILLLVIVVAGISLLLMNRQKESGSADDAKDKTPKDYEKVERGSLTIVVEGTGIVEPRTEVRIKSEASGQIEQFFAEEGDNLVKGQIIAKLDQENQQLIVQQAVIAEKQARLHYEQAKSSAQPQQLKSAEARVDELQLSLKNAQDRLKRIEKLYERDYVTDQEIEDARKAVDSLKLQLEEAELALKLLKEQDYKRNIETARLSWERAKVDLTMARKALGDATITCPIDGTVLLKSVEEGDTVVSSNQGFTEGTTLCTVADLSQVQVRGSVDEVDIGTVAEGQTAELTVDAYPDRTYEGQVVNIFPQGTQSPGGLTTFTVIVEVANEDRSLLANMTASISITTVEMEDLLLVPFAAIRPGEKPDEYAVFVRNE
ncbi:MAG: hypothetical protein A2Y63_05010, partial [Candidatus Riflebacteria bacterium RBG_13_59_9]